MSSRIQLVMLQLANLPAVPDGPGRDNAILSRKNVLFNALQAHGYKPCGTASGKVKDIDWDSDITQLVNRSLPHDIQDEDNNIVSVTLKLATLRVTIDDNDEVVSWQYEESAA